MPQTSVRHSVVAVLAAASLAACGSTAVQQTTAGGGLSTGLDDPSMVAPGTTASTSSLGNGFTSSPTASGGATSPGSIPSATDSFTGGTSTATRAGTLKAGSTLRVGIPYVDQQQSSALTAGISSGLETGDTKKDFEVLIADLNKAGGILGRQVVPVFHKVDFNEPTTQYEQEVCTDFTQDHKVPFVLSAVSPDLARCLLGRGIGVLGDGGQLNTKDYDTMRYYVQPGSFALDRLAVLQASEFTKMGLFKGTLPAKVGILTYDTPTYTYAEKFLRDGLKQRGIQVVAEEYLHLAGSTVDLPQTQAQVQSAVLKFKTLGVTHVLGVENNAWLQGFFALYGSQQDYYPRYGWTSNQVPTNAQAAVPHRALQTSLVLGFFPMFDTEKQADYPAETRACFKQMMSHGIAITSGNMRSAAAAACDTIRYLKAALTAGQGVDRAALVAGGRALGHTFKPAVTYGSFLPKGYGAGASSVRPGAWNFDCDCFAYTGRPYQVS